MRLAKNASNSCRFSRFSTAAEISGRLHLPPAAAARNSPPAARPGRGSDMPPACHSLPRPSSPARDGEIKNMRPTDGGAHIFGEEENLESEPSVKSAWEERERGRESSFAFERSGSFRAVGAAPKKRESGSDSLFFGDPYGTRTHVTAVKGRCLNHLTNGP